MMKIVNNGSINKSRKDTVPSSIKNDHNFVFGIKSDLDPQHSSIGSLPGVYTSQKGASSMHKIITHSDNLMEDLQRKIAVKLALEGQQQRRFPTKRISKTKASELRSQSVLTHKTMQDMGKYMQQMRADKAHGNDRSLANLEMEKIKLNNALCLPPI
jgi:hypothetical protein